MSLDVKRKGKTAKVRLTGELSIYTVAEIKTGLAEVMTKASDIEVDLSGVTEVDTAGLQLMLIAKRSPGKTVRFINHPRALLRLVDLANLGSVLGDPLVIAAGEHQGAHHE